MGLHDWWWNTIVCFFNALFLNIFRITSGLLNVTDYEYYENEII